MKLQCLSSDKIFSALPQNTIEHILTLMPIRDALKTSILSRNWRYCWTGMPTLVFDDKMINVSSNRKDINKYKLVNAIFHVLLQHKGPILELSIYISRTKIGNEMDQIILLLSRSNTMKILIFEFCKSDGYTLPYSFFSFDGLEHLSLANCALELPLMFNGFSMLKSLIFVDVLSTIKTLRKFLTKSPLLEEVTLILSEPDFDLGGDKCSFVELFKFLPLVQLLEINHLYMQHFSAGGMSQKLPTSLVHLRILVLEMCFQEQDEFSSALYVISCSPNLEKIIIHCLNDILCAQQPFTIDRFDPQRLNLDHLKELEITCFNNFAAEMEFVNLIMAKSPVLKKAQIELNYTVSVDEEVKML